MYGEDAESALRFLFNATALKVRPSFPFQGRPKMLYLDNGPVAKSHVFQNMMQSLKVDWLTHTPAGRDIGYRTDIFTLDGITGSQREYIQWLLKTSTGKGKLEDILTTEAVDLLAMKLRTPLQVQLHLKLAMEAGYQTGEKPITATLVESVLSRIYRFRY